MVRLQSLRTDSDKAEGGVWIPWIQGVRCKLAMYGNAKFQDKLQELRRPHADISGRLTDEKAEEIMVHSLADAVFLDFEGFEDEDGEPIENTLENRIMLLGDKGLRHFADWVTSQSQILTHFLHGQAAVVAGNS